MKRITLSLAICLISLSSLAQDYKGIWHGYITGEGLYNKSWYALNVKSQEGNIITGRAYIYGNFLFVFWGVMDFIGTIDKGNLKITELSIKDQEMPRLSLCTKFADVNYSKTGKEEYLKGTWETIKGNDCPAADALLKRYVSEKDDPDFPAELMKKIKEDTNKGIPFKETILTKPFVLNITKPTITIELRDYLKEDNDTVTVFVNRDEVITRRRISNRVYRKTIHFKKLSGLNEIIVYANNLGRIPPNTCVMVIDDGNSKQRINIFSSKQSSAVIYLNYMPLAAKPLIQNDDFFRDELRKAQLGPAKEPRQPGMRY
ncbi:MAG: hypothetical protein H7Y13_11555 [Sphingobacteriaceae bacterium]|nr:hypothetical protein [Sphingobacteriaceae bacterium]